MNNYTINNNQITFADNRFYTTDNGESVPSVTTILQAYPKDAHFYTWLKQVGESADDIRDEAGRRGSIVHNLTERYDAGEEISLINDFGTLDFKLSEWAMFERYIDFRNHHDIDIIHSEFNLIDRGLGYAGTIDRVITINGRNVLVDIKTSNAVHEFYWLQLAAYYKLLSQHYQSYNCVDDVAILWLNAKTRTYGKGDAIQGPGWQLIFRDQDQRRKDFDLFNATHMLWSHQNDNIKPKSFTYQIKHKL